MNNFHHYSEYGKLYSIVSLLFTVLSIAPSDLEIGLKIILLTVSIITAILAGRYHWLAYKEKKIEKELKEFQLKKEKETYEKN